MKGIWAVPIVLSILILGTLGLSQEAFSLDTVISGPVTDDLSVGIGDSLTITTGGVVTGNIEVKGGTLVIADGGKVIGDIEAKKFQGTSASLTIIGDDNDATKEVTGSIEAKGSSVSITFSAITGSVELKNSEIVRITDSTVDSEVEVKKTEDGAALIDVVVARNEVDGKLQILDNEGGYLIGVNIVHGDVQVNGNEGTFGLGAAVGGNTIDGNLECQDNDVGPIGVLSNTVAGDVDCAD